MCMLRKTKVVLECEMVRWAILRHHDAKGGRDCCAILR
jgi:hypothetical protein